MPNVYDIDGVIYLGPGLKGLHPHPDDIIITGRSYEEEPETIRMLHSRGIHNKVYFNPLPFNKKTRISSGRHKANTLNQLKKDGVKIGVMFEDDEVQVSEINRWAPWVLVIHLVHDLVDKENKRQEE